MIKNENIYDVIIIGGGASALMCAATINANSDLKLLILEKNDSLAKKVKISGGGKCNITNVDVQAKHYLGNEYFINDVFRLFNKEDLLNFLNEHNLTPTIRKNRYYFCQKSSDEIISLFLKQMQKSQKVLNSEVTDVVKEGDTFAVKCATTTYRALNVVVATGAISFSQVGVSGIGLKIAEQFGHQTVPFSSALCGLTLQKEQFWMKNLSGISTEVKIEIDGRTIKEDLLFAHKGISGPAVLSASLYWYKGTLCINFLPNCKLEELLHRSKKLLSTLLPLPKRFTQEFLKSVSLEDKSVANYKDSELQIIKTLQAYTFSPAGHFGLTKAEVCRGGVVVKKIDAKSMMSKLVDNLYFIGEVVDVTGELGGYNFQWAFSSGFVAGQAIYRKKL